MNLKNFKLLKEDDDHFYVGHPKGKQLKVKKSGLNSKAKELVLKLRSKQGYAEGGEVIADEDFKPDVEAPDVPFYLKPNEVELGRDAAAKYFMQDQSSMQPNPANAEQIIAQQPVVGQSMAQNIDNNELIRKATQAGLTVDEFLKQQQNQPAANQDYKVIEESVIQPKQDIQPVQDFTQGYEAQKQAMLQEGEALKQKGLEEARLGAEAQAKVEKMPTQEEILQDFQRRDEDLLKAYESKVIDPERYLKNRDTGTKFAQGIALILGGIGAGLTGGPNVVLNMIHKKIEDDIASQKEDKQSAFNLWKMNKEALGDTMSANLATQNQIYTGLKFQLARAASTADSKVAAARAQQAIAQIDQAIGQNRLKLSLLQTPEGGSEVDAVKRLSALKMLAPEQAKEREERYIPGVGFATIKPTEKDREALTSSKSAKGALTELQALATQGMTAPGTVASGVNKAKVAALQLQLKQAYQLGVLSATDIDMLNSLVADPGSFFTERSINQLEATKKSMDAVEKGIIQKLGVKPFQQQAEMKTMGGVPYMRTAGGWQKVK